MRFVILILSFLGLSLLMGYSVMKNNDNNFKNTNKIIPTIIETEANIALSFYPALKDTHIEFVIKPSLSQSFMKAQPVFSTVFGLKKNRKYKILISDSFALENKKLTLNKIPQKVLVGWLGHELGHIMDYKNRSALNMVGFGIRYYFSESYIRKAERIADSYAISHDMKEYILATKNFILNNADLSDKYKARIKRLYVSPNEILKIVEEQNK